MLIAAPGKSLKPLWTMASNTGCVSESELLMTSSTSDVAVCCSECLGEFSRAGLNFLEQPGVLDCDHGLVGKGGNELNLLVDEGLGALARQDESADRSPFPKKGNAEHCA